jgi:diketogulonate reductase-like aldo/keto reductase
MTLALAAALCALSVASASAAVAPAAHMPKLWLADGVAAPAISLGCGGGFVGNRSLPGPAVSTWLIEAGGRGVDTAFDYDNNDLVGHAFKEAFSAGLSRDDIFVTSKQPGPIGYEATLTSVVDSLFNLTLDYSDLHLIHFPEPQMLPAGKTAKQMRQETWLGMEAVLEQGLVRAIGVSNFNQTHIADIMEVATVTPAVNQVLFNPVQHDMDLLAYCDSLGIRMEAWSPLGGHDSRHGSVLDNPLMKKVAAAHGVSTAQVAIRWALQHGLMVTTGTSNSEHMRTDVDVYNFRLTDAELAAISELQGGARERGVKMARAPRRAQATVEVA